MMKVRIHTATSTKNKMVNAVGNLKRRLGLTSASSGSVSVSAVTEPVSFGYRALRADTTFLHCRHPFPGLIPGPASSVPERRDENRLDGVHAVLGFIENNGVRGFK